MLETGQHKYECYDLGCQYPLTPIRCSKAVQQNRAVGGSTGGLSSEKAHLGKQDGLSVNGLRAGKRLLTFNIVCASPLPRAAGRAPVRPAVCHPK